MLQIPVDLTPVDFRALTAAYPQRYPVLFDSVTEGTLARWSVLTIGSGASLWIDAKRRLHGVALPVPQREGFLATLDDWWRHEHAATAREPIAATGGSPWRAGWAIFLGYELAAEIEPSLRLPAGPEDCLGFALRTPAALVFDHLTSSCTAVIDPGNRSLVDRTLADAREAPRTEFASTAHPLLLPGSLRESSPEEFVTALQRAQAHIGAGDIYQANLSRRWCGELAPNVTAAELYERLRVANPAPFACRAQFAGLDIQSSSPERLLHIADGQINTRPIAGTRPRLAQSTQDREQVAALLANHKERAEHVMLIDLERNDLGRVCAPGSVEVSEFMVVESYAHVHHIVSNVRGRLRADVTPVAALRAVFPGGTITGCPKVRCMKIIAQLEGQGRGVYTGSLGWIGVDGSIDSNILIRTLSVTGRELSFRAGCGIVADSVAQLELEETRAKARGMLRALGEAA